MSEEKTCKTCTWFNQEAYYCKTFATSMAEWDSCDSHETYEEMITRIKITMKECPDKEHGLFQENYLYCPYCGKSLQKPSFDSDKLGSEETT